MSSCEDVRDGSFAFTAFELFGIGAQVKTLTRKNVLNGLHEAVWVLFHQIQANVNSVVPFLEAAIVPYLHQVLYLDQALHLNYSVL